MRSAGLAMVFVCISIALAPARADEGLRDQAVALVDRWIAAQNSGDAAAYAACYSATADRPQLLPRPSHVEAVHIEVSDLPEHEMRVTFTLTRDRDNSCTIEHRRMTVADERGALRIRREETSSASDVPGPCGHRCDPGCSAYAPPQSRRREIHECEVACTGSAEDCVRYADIYAAGQCGTERDLARAIQIDEDACRRRERLACRAAARLLHERNEAGDVARAIALLEPSCRAARDCVDVDLFTRLLRARNATDDTARALRILTASCTNGADAGEAAKACDAAAEMYDRGEGAAQNARRARELRARAARLWRAAGKPSCCAE